MKIRWLIILSAVFVGIIFISLLITQQHNNTASLIEEHKPQNTQLTNNLQIAPARIISAPHQMPAVKSAITVIKTPVSEVQNKIPAAGPLKSIPAIKSTPSRNSLANTAKEGSAQAGITIVGKRPTPKEAQEMNSAGIVMY